MRPGVSWGGASSSWRSIGIPTMNGRRSRSAYSTVAATVASTVRASRSGMKPAPTASAIAASSIVWLTCLPRAVSPASSSSGVCSRTAADSDVRVLVTPGPWWTVAIPRPCVTCA